MENKAPGTAPRPGGYDTAGGGATHENFFHPRMKMKEKSIQRAGLRSSKRTVFFLMMGISVFVLAPTYIGPLYVKYVAGQNWIERAKKSIWTRRNEKDYDLYMTQRKNGWLEYLGLKHYNIGGDDNIGDIQTYRQKEQ